MPDIAVAAKRYDGASGNAVFRGTIPMKPGTCFTSTTPGSEALVTTPMSLWDGGTEIGIRVVALWPLHPDGSTKVVELAAELNLPNTTQKNLTLKLGTAASVPGPGLPLVDVAWLRAPRLIACTDATYLCESRVSHLPLVPATHPNLAGTNWGNFLTNEFVTFLTDPTFGGREENWGAIRANVLANTALPIPPLSGSDAYYSLGSCVYMTYLMTGTLDYLREAMAWSGYDASFITQYPRSGTVFKNGSLMYGEAWGVHAVDEVIPTEVLWPYVSPAGRTYGYRDQSASETNADYFDLWYEYVLAGSQQALVTLMLEQRQHGFEYPLRDFWSWYGSTFESGSTHARYFYRHARMTVVLGYMLSVPFDIKSRWEFGATKVIPSPRKNPAFYTDFLKAHLWDNLELWSVGTPEQHIAALQAGGFFTDRGLYPSGFPADDFRRGAWGFCPWWGKAANAALVDLNEGTCPAFQLQQFFMCVMMAWLHIPTTNRPSSETARARLLRTCQIVKEQVRQCPWGLRPTVNGPKIPGQYYWIWDGITGPIDEASGFRYLIATRKNPVLVHPLHNPQADGSDLHPASIWTMDTLWAFTFGAQLTQNPVEKAEFLAFADQAATVRYNGDFDGRIAGSKITKDIGEIFQTAYPAAAYRAGVAWDGWDLAAAGALTIGIQSPTSAPTYVTVLSTVTLAGIASDTTGGTITDVTWTNAETGGSGTATGTTSWSITDIPLLPGPNLITVTVTNDADVTADAGLTVTYAFTPNPAAAFDLAVL